LLTLLRQDKQQPLLANLLWLKINLHGNKPTLALNLKKLKTAQLWASISAPYKPSLFQLAALHQRLEARREEARLGGGWGPRVAVVGPTDAGKSSLCRVLAAYAARCGRAVTVVDTDVGQVRARRTLRRRRQWGGGDCGHSTFSTIV
jgi:Mrp family chromosome partitioning ATPase